MNRDMRLTDAELVLAQEALVTEVYLMRARGLTDDAPPISRRLAVVDKLEAMQDMPALDAVRITSPLRTRPHAGDGLTDRLLDGTLAR